MRIARAPETPETPEATTSAATTAASPPVAPPPDVLFGRHAALVYRTAYGVTGRHEDAEDVLQTVFLRLVRRECPLALTSNPQAYLYRAAVNASLDTVRSRRRLVLVDSDTLPERPAPSSDSPDHCDESDELHHCLYAAIAQLPRATAEILILRYVHDKSDAEIAKMLGVSRGTIALKLFRSRARLKRLLSARMRGKS